MAARKRKGQRTSTKSSPRQTSDKEKTKVRRDRQNEIKEKSKRFKAQTGTPGKKAKP